MLCNWHLIQTLPKNQTFLWDVAKNQNKRFFRKSDAHMRKKANFDHLSCHRNKQIFMLIKSYQISILKFELSVIKKFCCKVTECGANHLPKFSNFPSCALNRRLFALIWLQGIGSRSWKECNEEYRVVFNCIEIGPHVNTYNWLVWFGWYAYYWL